MNEITYAWVMAAVNGSQNVFLQVLWKYFFFTVKVFKPFHEKPPWKFAKYLYLINAINRIGMK